MNADGSDLRPVTTGGTADFQPAWSPDGRRLLFESARSGGSDIYVMDADGSNVTRLTDDPAADTHPRWSPDGETISPGSVRPGRRFATNCARG